VILLVTSRGNVAAMPYGNLAGMRHDSVAEISRCIITWILNTIVTRIPFNFKAFCCNFSGIFSFVCSRDYL
jgi:hypothetical protein